MWKQDASPAAGGCNHHAMPSQWRQVRRLRVELLVDAGHGARLAGLAQSFHGDLISIEKWDLSKIISFGFPGTAMISIQ